MDSQILKAAHFCRKAHFGQARKVTGKPYATHPAKVASRIFLLDFAESYGNHAALVIAAFLHDVVEDTPVTIEEINLLFGDEVARLVVGLTNEYTKHAYPKLTRKERKKLENQKIAQLATDTKLIKLADRIDNLEDMTLDDNFLPVYLEESKLLAQHINCNISELYSKDFYILLDELNTTIEHWELLRES